ncbi:MAG TPA: proline--tRNA ligase [Blastocatellia bacterium]|nr:proline--tRNA ligase [Blastocatellia bacterium]
MAEKITPRNEDYSRWYLDVIRDAELAESSPVRGCMVIRPYGFALWEAVRDGLDRRFKATGHVNAYFPLFIPLSFFQKEAEHVEGFAKECAVVTHHRLMTGEGGLLVPDPEAKLEEPLIVRPTSETIIGHSFANWIQSYRDLPLLINQWANVVRWELRTRPFLRTTEFLWQEGHTAHATEAEAVEETLTILHAYADFAVNDAAIPVIKGRKSARERFAGAVDTYAIEAMMGNGWALQAGTSHYLGTNFARGFEIMYLDRNNEKQYCHTTSWGVSTRMVGAIIMAHGDDQGLRLPPAIAPVQAVIVPIWRKDPERVAVMEHADNVHTALVAAGVRVRLDTRDDVSPGYKFNDWEMRGVPVRIEIGPRDVEQNAVVLARRDVPGKEGKQFGVPVDGVAAAVRDLLASIQSGLLRQATEYRDANTRSVSSYDEFKQVIDGDGGFIRAHWAGSDEDEDLIKEETKATLRCFPSDVPEGEGVCFFTGKRTSQVAIFARAY